MESPTSQLKTDPHMSPPPAHSSPGPTHGTLGPLSLAHGVNIHNLNHAASLLNKLQKTTTYSSPPPIACSPENNVCKLIEYRGAKIAAFVVENRELICLPQAFELFLKHLVGGLHTVYTKLKRLDIIPVVCNVEQVRILRGLGAIQPGVNRCKLISCKEFDILYEDCTNSNARPGRPPKRSPSIHASPETLEKLKKSRLDGSEYPFDPRLFGDRKSLLNGFPHHPYAMGPLPFMPLNHPMMSPPVSMAMATHLGLRHDGTILKDRSGSESDLLSPRSREERTEKNDRLPTYENKIHRPTDYHDNNKPLNLQINGHMKDLSKYSSNGKSEDEEEDDRLSDDQEDYDDSPSGSDCVQNSDMGEKVIPTPSLASQLLNGETQGLSSIETLLLNIQGLLKVAAENARHHERQYNFEKAELKMELIREREVREALEKQLIEEQKNKSLLQKRLKKEKKVRRKLQEQTEMADPGKSVLNSESSAVLSPESLRNAIDAAHDKESERASHNDTEQKISDTPDRSNHLFESFLAHGGSNGTNRFPYLPMIKSDVQ